MKFIKYLTFLSATLFLCSYYPAENYDEDLYSPILMGRTDLESSVQFQTEHKMENPGKIYMKENFIYIVEKYKGVHIIDNSNRSNPVRKGFIVIPGCIDVAIKDNNLFADNAVDLVSISIEDLGNITVNTRIVDAFPEITPPNKDFIPYNYSKVNRPENTVIVGWQLKSK